MPSDFAVGASENLIVAGIHAFEQPRNIETLNILIQSVISVGFIDFNGNYEKLLKED